MEGKKVLLDSSHCEDILNSCTNWERSQVYTNNGTKVTEISSFRKGAQVSLSAKSGSPLYSFLYDLSKLNGITLLSSEIECMVCRYNEGEYIKYHNDKLGNENRRYFISVQLSSSDSYTGGDFIYYENSNPHLISRERGSGCLLSSTVYHEVKEVTSGTRYSLIYFIHKGKFEANKSAI